MAIKAGKNTTATDPRQLQGSDNIKKQVGLVYTAVFFRVAQF